MKFIQEANDTASSGGFKESFGLIYNNFENLMKENKDLSFLSELDVDKLNENIIMAILTATLPVKKNKHRQVFLKKCIQEFENKGINEVGLFKGL